MIPNIFISSTILDFHHLRDAVRDTILELEYNPVMSEYGDIGYLPSVSAEESCYQTLKDCQLAIILIGKRYGSISENGNSVTYNEFITAKKNNKPVICLVEREVLAYKKVFDINYPKSVPSFPGMDAPVKTFEFVDEFIKSTVNNGFLEFSTVADVRRHLKRQMAHIFGDFLRKQYDHIKVEIQDILSEVKTLRYELLKDEKSTYEPLLKTFRFLLSERNSELKEFIEKLADEIDNAVPKVLESASFKNFLDNMRIQLLIEDEGFFAKRLKEKKDYKFMTAFAPEIKYQDYENKKIRHFHYIIDEHCVIFDEGSFNYFDLRFSQLLEAIKTK